ncbi:MAG TPA: N-acetylneuraminate synthase [Chryseosolibacter sp.]
MKTLIIAEAGVNHNGSMEFARQLIDIASDAGADYVKFQTFKTEKLVSIRAEKASYQMKNMKSDHDAKQFGMLKKLELSEDNFRELKRYCSKKKIKFLSTGFDLSSLEFLNRLGIDFFKIPSGEATNLPYLKKVASFGKPIVLSTGMCTMGDIENAIQVLVENGIKRKAISVLHCNTEYPTPLEDVNLKAISSIHAAFRVDVGYSDHTAGTVIPIAAVAAGATIIEKHFTIDRAMDGPDHKASLNPQELKYMVSAIRAVEKALGDGVKRPSRSELKNLVIARKSIHLSRDLKKGEVIKESDIEMLRPGDGITPMEASRVIGKSLNRSRKKGYKLTYSDLKN